MPKVLSVEMHTTTELDIYTLWQYTQIKNMYLKTKIFQLVYLLQQYKKKSETTLPAIKTNHNVTKHITLCTKQIQH